MVKTHDGTRLAALMKRAGVTDAKLAAALGASVQAVGKWKRQGVIARERIAGICRTLHCSSDELLGLQPIGTPSARPFDPEAQERMARHGSISALYDARRTRLNAILQDIPAAELGRRADIDPAYIYQMAKGEGGNRRNISDEMVEKIERAFDWPAGAFDAEHFLAEPESPSTESLDHDRLAEAIAIVTRVLPPNHHNRDPQGRADIVIAVYEYLQHENSVASAERMVKGMLQVLSARGKAAEPSTGESNERGRETAR